MPGRWSVREVGPQRRTTSPLSCDIAPPASPPDLASTNASAELSRGTRESRGYPPLREMSDLHRREFRWTALRDNGEGLLQPESWAQISVAFPFSEYEVTTNVSAS
jgi:hypothetical protein